MKIAICEDNVQLLSLYKVIIGNFRESNPDKGVELSLATSSPNTLQSFAKMNTTQPIFYILDVEFANSEIKGIDLAEQIRRQNSRAQIVFISSHEEFSSLAIERKIMPLDYIEKNKGLAYIEEQLKQDLTAAIASKEKFSYSIGQHDYTIDVDQILYIQNSHDSQKIIVYTRKSVIEFHDSLDFVARQLPEFLRLNATTLVNLQNIKDINENEPAITFIGDVNFKISGQEIKLLKHSLSSL
ncbi:LytR/AlgR family response regulator transcription factor [Agrilactobacillus fermenti]|uniref:LytR/AlgR family response regulator transcription factor n=1 Tax=Agrilactobacillus fermenti TaxID=2586909 RepID=UPI003A5BC760